MEELKGKYDFNRITELTDNSFKGEFTTFSVSPRGDKYIKKIVLPKDFAIRIDREVAHFNEPKIFLYYICTYIYSKDFYWNSHYTNLIANSRKEFFNHDLCQFILYKEQALYFAAYILSNLADTREEEIENDISILWVRDLALGLIKFANTLPTIDKNKTNLYSISSFDISSSPYRNKLQQNKRDLLTYIVLFSPISIHFRYILLDILAFVLKIGGIHIKILLSYFLVHGYICIVRDSEIKKNIRELFNKIKVIIKENKYKFLLSLTLNFFANTIFRLFKFSKDFYKTGLIIVTGNVPNSTQELRRVLNTVSNALLHRTVFNHENLNLDLNREEIKRGINRRMLRIKKDNNLYFDRGFYTRHISEYSKDYLKLEKYDRIVLRERQKYLLLSALDNDPVLQKFCVRMSQDADKKNTPSSEIFPLITLKETLGVEYSDLERPREVGKGDIMVRVINEEGNIDYKYYELRSNHKFYGDDRENVVQLVSIKTEELALEGKGLIIDSQYVGQERFERLKKIVEEENLNVIVLPPQSMIFRKYLDTLNTRENCDQVSDTIDEKSKWIVNDLEKRGEDLENFKDIRDDCDILHKKDLLQVHSILDQKLGKEKSNDFEKFKEQFKNKSDDYDID